MFFIDNENDVMMVTDTSSDSDSQMCVSLITGETEYCPRHLGVRPISCEIIIYEGGET